MLVVKFTKPDATNVWLIFFFLYVSSRTNLFRSHRIDALDSWVLCFIRLCIALDTVQCTMNWSDYFLSIGVLLISHETGHDWFCRVEHEEVERRKNWASVVLYCCFLVPYLPGVHELLEINSNVIREFLDLKNLALYHVNLSHYLV